MNEEAEMTEGTKLLVDDDVYDVSIEYDVATKLKGPHLRRIMIY